MNIRAWYKQRKMRKLIQQRLRAELTALRDALDTLR